MQRLALLRHATAASQGEVPGDRERPLSQRGREEADRWRNWMEGDGNAPSAVLCSPSLRTLETWDRIGTGVERTTVEALYLGTTEAYLAAIDHALLEHDSVLVVGHNPTCAELALSFRSAEPGDGRYPPATLCLATRADADAPWTVDRILRVAELPAAP